MQLLRLEAETAAGIERLLTRPTWSLGLAPALAERFEKLLGPKRAAEPDSTLRFLLFLCLCVVSVSLEVALSLSVRVFRSLIRLSAATPKKRLQKNKEPETPAAAPTPAATADGALAVQQGFDDAPPMPVRCCSLSAVYCIPELLVMTFC